MWVQFLVGAEIFFFAISSRSALSPTWPPVQLILGPLFLWQGGKGMKLTMQHLGWECGGAVSPLHHVFMMWCLPDPRDNYAFFFMCRGQCCKLQAPFSWQIWRDTGKEIAVQGLSLDLNSTRNIWEVNPLHSYVLRESGGHRRPASLLHRLSRAAGIHLVTCLPLLTRVSHLLIILTV
jgi:hypothetical protein